MIISRAPFRISFFGGGTDYPAWYRNHGGQVLATTINKYCYITCRHRPPFMEHRIRLAYSRIESCQRPDDIAHPVIREALRFLALDRGMEIHHDADLPGRSGMGSSSSFTVGLLQALHALKGEMVSKRQLADEAIRLEQQVLAETVGSQDQMLAAFGGLRHIQFRRDGEIVVRPVTIPSARREALEDHLLLFYTAIKRTASDVAASYVEGIEERGAELERMGRMVDEGLDALNGDGPIEELGELLDEAWQLKRGLSALTSNDRVDEIYSEARAAGALGGKLTGAGGGGFMLLFAPPGAHGAVRQRLSRLIHVPFSFEPSGSEIIFFDPEPDYAVEDRQRLVQELEAFEELSELTGGDEETG